MMGVISPKLRASARGQDCTFGIPGICNYNAETTVLCHAPSEVKGMGNKGHDYHAAFGCADCHKTLDEHRLSSADEYFFWLRGVMRTQNQWFNAGLIELSVEAVKTRPTKKEKLPTRPIRSRNNLRREERNSLGAGNDPARPSPLRSNDHG